MDSLIGFKGYGRVIDQEKQVSTQQRELASRKTLIITITVSTILMVLVLVGFLTAASTSDDRTGLDPAKSLQTICTATQHPNLCLASLSSAANGSTLADPDSVFKLSLQITMKDLSKLSYAFRTINDLPEDVAIRDCLSLFDDAMSRLNDSVSAMDAGTGEKALTDQRIGDVRTWISAGLTDLETCSDGLTEMGSTIGGKIEAKMNKCKELMSNCLGIASRMKELCRKCHCTMTMH